MSPIRYAAGLVVLLATALTTVPCEAVFHLWYIKEIYSNHDGSVQFIEFFTTSTQQQQNGGQQVTTASGNSYTFPNNITTNQFTASHHMLLATSTYDALANSPTPNYPNASFPTAFLPANFFNPAGDTITFVGADSKTFSGATAIPIDGVMSRTWPGFGSAGSTTGTNSPTNFLHATGSISSPPPAPSPDGDYNDDGIVDLADYIIWRKTLNSSVSPNGSGADGDADGTIDPGDYDFWVKRFGNDISGAGGAGAVPEPVVASLFVSGLILLTLRFRSRP